MYVYQNRRITPKIQLSESLEKMFVPYSVEELEKMESPYVDEIREWTESKRHLLAGNNAWPVCSSLILEGSSTSWISLPFCEFNVNRLMERGTKPGETKKGNSNQSSNPGNVLLSTQSV